MDKKLMYKTPRASVRGVFLCENVAMEPTSVLTVGITQEEWPATDASASGDLWIAY
jgi:hypothetical protein